MSALSQSACWGCMSRTSSHCADLLKGQRSFGDWSVVLMLLVIVCPSSNKLVGRVNTDESADGGAGTQGENLISSVWWHHSCPGTLLPPNETFRSEYCQSWFFFLYVFETMTHSFGKCHHPPNSKEEDLPQCHHSSETGQRNEEKPKWFVSLTYNLKKPLCLFMQNLLPVFTCGEFLMDDLKAPRLPATFPQPGNLNRKVKWHQHVNVCLTSVFAFVVVLDIETDRWLLRDCAPLSWIRLYWRCGANMWTFKRKWTAVCVLLRKPAEKTLHAAPSSMKNSIPRLRRHPYGLAPSWQHAYSSFHIIQLGKCLICGPLHLLAYGESWKAVQILVQRDSSQVGKGRLEEDLHPNSHCRGLKCHSCVNLAV